MVVYGGVIGVQGQFPPDKRKPHTLVYLHSCFLLPSCWNKVILNWSLPSQNNAKLSLPIIPIRIVIMLFCSKTTFVETAVYVICRLGGKYGEKLWPRAWYTNETNYYRWRFFIIIISKYFNTDNAKAGLCPLANTKKAFNVRTALWAEKLGRCLENCMSWKNTLGKLVVAVKLEAIWSEVWKST